MSEPLDLEAIAARWCEYGGMGNPRSADDYTDAGCRILAEHGFRDIPALIARVRELEAAIDNIGTVIDDPEGWGWTDQDGMLESIGNTVESAGRPVIWQ